MKASERCTTAPAVQSSMTGRGSDQFTVKCEGGSVKGETTCCRSEACVIAVCFPAQHHAGTCLSRDPGGFAYDFLSWKSFHPVIPDELV